MNNLPKSTCKCLFIIHYNELRQEWFSILLASPRAWLNQTLLACSHLIWVEGDASFRTCGLTRTWGCRGEPGNGRSGQWPADGEGSIEASCQAPAAGLLGARWWCYRALSKHNRNCLGDVGSASTQFYPTSPWVKQHRRHIHGLKKYEVNCTLFNQSKDLYFFFLKIYVLSFFLFFSFLPPSFPPSLPFFSFFLCTFIYLKTMVKKLSLYSL